MQELIIKIVLVVGAAAAGYAAHYLPGWKQDNVVEEACEEVIKQETGADVDLTPESPEKKE